MKKILFFVALSQVTNTQSVSFVANENNIDAGITNLNSAFNKVFRHKPLIDIIISFLDPIVKLQSIQEMLNYHEITKQMLLQSGSGTFDEVKWGCFNDRVFVARLIELVKNDVSEDFRFVIKSIQPMLWVQIQQHQFHAQGLKYNSELYALKVALAERYCNACIEIKKITDEDAQALRYLQVGYNDIKNPSIFAKVMDVLRSLNYTYWGCFKAETDEQKLY